MQDHNVGANKWRRTGVLTFDGNANIKEKVTYRKIQKHLLKIYGRHFAYGTVVELRVARNKHQRSSKRYRGLANVTSRRVRKGFHSNIHHMLLLSLEASQPREICYSSSRESRTDFVRRHKKTEMTRAASITWWNRPGLLPPFLSGGQRSRERYCGRREKAWKSRLSSGRLIHNKAMWHRPMCNIFIVKYRANKCATLWTPTY